MSFKTIIALMRRVQHKEYFEISVQSTFRPLTNK